MNDAGWVPPRHDPEPDLAKARQDETARQRRARSRGRGLYLSNIALSIGLAASVGLHVWAEATKQPVQYVPLIMNEDGTYDQPAASGAEQGDLQLKVALWRYVKARESWIDNFAIGQDNWNFVTDLSDDEEAKRYQDWAGPDNPEAPQRKYKKGEIKPVLIGVYFSKLAPNEADVRYRKIVTKDGVTTKTTWTTRIVFKVSKTITKRQAATVGIGLTVKHYQNSEDAA